MCVVGPHEDRTAGSWSLFMSPYSTLNVNERQVLSWALGPPRGQAFLALSFQRSLGQARRPQRTRCTQYHLTLRQVIRTGEERHTQEGLLIETYGRVDLGKAPGR